MLWLETETVWLQLFSVLEFGVNWLVQSTLLIAVGLVIGRLLRHQGAAVESLVYRTTLVAALLCPLATLGLAHAGFSGFQLALIEHFKPVTIRVEPGPTAALPIVTDSPMLSVETQSTPSPRTFEPIDAASELDRQPPDVSRDVDIMDAPAEYSSNAVSKAIAAPETYSEVVQETRPRVTRAAWFGLGALTAWLIVSVSLAFRLVKAYWQLERLYRSTSLADSHTLRACHELAREMQVVAPDVRLSPFIPSPCLVGLQRPTVLMPNVRQCALRDALVHELAHLKRHDCHWNLLRQVATSLFFFQPLLWVLSRKIESTAEEVCDDFVITLGGNPHEYANQLVDIAELSTAPVTAAGVGIVSLRSMLARRVIRIMDSSRNLSTRVGNVLLAMVLIGGVLSTAGVGLVGLNPPRSDAQDGSSAAVDADLDNDSQNETENESRSDIDERYSFQGRVIDPDGKPVKGAEIFLSYYRPQPTGLLIPDADPIAITDADGVFRFAVSAEDMSADDTMLGPGGGALVAVKDGYGFAWSTAGSYETDGKWLENAKRRLQELPKAFAAPFAATLEVAGKPLQLVKDEQPIRGRLVDINGQPVAGARLMVVEVATGIGDDLTEWEQAAEQDKADFYVARMKTPRGMNSSEVRTVVPPAVTDQDGRFVLKGVGANRIVRLMITGEDIATERIYARTKAGEKIELLRERRAPHLGKYTYYPASLTHVVGPSIPITGIVKDAETQEPLAGVTIKSQARHGERINGLGQDFVRAVTDRNGRYRLLGMPVGSDNRVAAIADGGQIAYLSQAKSAPTKVGQPSEIDFELRRGVWVEGRLTDKSTGEGMPGRIAYYIPTSNKLSRVGRTMRVDLRDMNLADSDGHFKIAVLPGLGYIAVMASDHERYPRASRITGVDGKPMESSTMVRTEPSYMHPQNYHLVQAIDPAEDAIRIELSVSLDAGTTITGRVVDPDGNPVTDFFYAGRMAAFMTWRQSTDGTFEVDGYEPDAPRHVYLVHNERNLAGHVLVQGDHPQDLVVTMRPSGRVTGRLVDQDGAPLTNYTLVPWSPPISDPSESNQYHAPPLPHNKVHLSSGEYETDGEGRFDIPGLVPGVVYRIRGLHRSSFSAGAVPRQRPNGPLDVIIQLDEGETKKLGDVSFADREAFLKAALPPKPDSADVPQRPARSAPPVSTELTRAAPEETTPQVTLKAKTIAGMVRLPDGSPAANVDVAIVAMRMTAARGGDLSRPGVIVGETKTNSMGRYQLPISLWVNESLTRIAILARLEGYGIAWNQIEMKSGQMDELKLANEEPIRGRLVTLEGQPIPNTKLTVQSVMKRSTNGFMNQEGTGFVGDEVPVAWLPAVTSDQEGRFTVRGVPEGFGALLQVEGNGQVAPQDIALNTGMPEQRGERDGTYRALVKNGKPDEEFLLALAPAQVFEGKVRYEDSGEVAPHARLTIWASQQEFGSMVLVAGTADDKGNYRISPRPGIRFGINAYAPAGTPYLGTTTPFSEAIRWTTGDRVKQIDVSLPRGVLVRGRVVAAGTGEPVAGALIQYQPESQNNEHTAPHILTGWQAATVSDQDGFYSMAVLPGPGRLLVHRQEGNFILTSVSDRELRSGKVGGRRNYPHAVAKIDPQPESEPIDLTIELTPGKAVRGTIVDRDGNLVDESTVITGLKVSPHSLFWRGHALPTLGGHFELIGLDPEQEYRVHFLDAKRKLGATAVIRTTDEEPQIELLPCGTAKARIVDANGEPRANFQADLHFILSEGADRFEAPEEGKLEADGDFVANVDRVNYWPAPKTDKDGFISFPALIPGAKYQIIILEDGKQSRKTFIGESGIEIDLGELVTK